MGLLISLFTSRFAGPIASVAAALLLALCLVQQGKLASRSVELAHQAKVLQKTQGQLDATHASLAACQANRQELQTALTDQDAAIRSQAAVATQRLAAAQTLAETAQRGRAKAEAAAASLLAPHAEHDTCADLQAAVTEIRETLK